ncbi:preprotein translocase subunit YajC [Romboutsia lituseburensis]|uniref:preprotein translocase subunit YajC n=1 Tax=Romboutsia lituseburensis TaxID=1537 RepID=UPI00215AEC89|nr:preprotein translocase subunit YajC [Romboutsia lituseburensis]MCR8744821.1 preprotein translocase subunit YajC [Romboutsia lituseburensis]
MSGNTMLLVVSVFIVYVGLLVFMRNKRKQQMDIQQKQRKEFTKNLKKGDYVVTMSGIYGYIKDINSNKVSLEVSKDVNINMDIEAIMATLEK